MKYLPFHLLLFTATPVEVHCQINLQQRQLANMLADNAQRHRRANR